MFHKGITLAIDKQGFWGVVISLRCRYLGKNRKCRIYNNRPPLCIKYSPHCCPGNKSEYKHHFKTLKQLEKYLKEKKKI